MSTSLTAINNVNTFGQWKDRTNQIITALGNTVTIGDSETNAGNIILTGDITSGGTLFVDTIDATSSNSANIITVNADVKVNGEMQVNNTVASEVKYYLSDILTWTAGTNATHTQFDIKKGSVVLRVDETAGAITGSGLIIDDSLLPDLITSNIDGNVTGQLLATDTERSHGAYGAYATTRIGHVWSMGTAYKIPDDGYTFGNLHGIAYYHPDNLTALTSPTYTAAQQLMASGNQIVFTNNGVPGVSIGLNGGNIWAKGNIYENETLLSTTYLNRVLGGTITGAISTNKAITLTGTGANGTVTAAKFAGPLTGAVTGNVTGNVTGDVTGNADTATKLATGRTIDITGDITATAVLFDGSSNIAISASVDNNSHTHTSSNITDASSTNAASKIVQRDGSGNFAAGTITATRFTGPVTGAVTGNASTATKLANSRTITLAGDASGSVSFDGSGNVTLTVAVSDDSHAHTYGNLTSIPSSFTPSSHTHGNLTNDGKIGTTASKVIVTSTGGAIAAKTSGTSGQFLNGLGAWATPPDNDTIYSHATDHPTTAGNKHVPSGGSSGKILTWSADGTATWATEYSYTHPTGAGYKHIPSGGATGQILKYSASGTATWATEYSYTHPSVNHIPELGSTGQILRWDSSGKAKWGEDVDTNTDTVYTHPITAGNKHVPSGGSTGNFLKYGTTSGEAVWSSLPSASTAVTGIVKLSSSVTGTSTSLAATESAVKAANDNANGRLGSSATAVSATKLATSRTIDITGDITATAVSFNGTANISISASVNNDSHSHTYSNLTSIPTTFRPHLNGYVFIGNNLVVGGGDSSQYPTAYTSSDNNVVISTNSKVASGSGDDNIAIGVSALYALGSGRGNVAVGRSAIQSATNNCEYNTGIGYEALFGVTTGENNIGLGMSAGRNITTGDGNIVIGGSRDYGYYSPVYTITTQSNLIAMGSTSVTNAYIKVGWTVTSDARDKTEIKEVPHGLDFVKQLSPVSYKFKESREDATPTGDEHYGFLAQDILAIEGENSVVVDSKDSEHLFYKDHNMTAVLVNAIKELTLKVEELEAKCAGL